MCLAGPRPSHGRTMVGPEPWPGHGRAAKTARLVFRERSYTQGLNIDRNSKTLYPCISVYLYQHAICAGEDYDYSSGSLWERESRNKLMSESPRCRPTSAAFLTAIQLLEGSQVGFPSAVITNLRPNQNKSSFTILTQLRFWHRRRLIQFIHPRAQ